jgi:hypothetical protein
VCPLKFFGEDMDGPIASLTPDMIDSGISVAQNDIMENHPISPKVIEIVFR